MTLRVARWPGAASTLLSPSLTTPPSGLAEPRRERRPRPGLQTIGKPSRTRTGLAALRLLTRPAQSPWLCRPRRTGDCGAPQAALQGLREGGRTHSSSRLELADARGAAAPPADPALPGPLFILIKCVLQNGLVLGESVFKPCCPGEWGLHPLPSPPPSPPWRRPAGHLHVPLQLLLLLRLLSLPHRVPTASPSAQAVSILTNPAPVTSEGALWWLSSRWQDRCGPA